MFTPKNTYSIIAMDDESGYLYRLEKILEHEGIKITFASIHDVLCLLNEGGFDLLLLNTDINMRIGLKIVDIIREKYPELPILIVTSSDADVGHRIMKRLGAKGFLYGPFYREIILTKLETVFYGLRKTNDN